MNATTRAVMFGGLGVVVLGLLWWLTHQAGASQAPAVGGSQLSLPVPLASVTPEYAPAVFNITDPANTSAGLTNPGDAVLFIFNPPASPILTTQPGTLGSGTSSADGATGPCNCPQQGMTAFGSEADAASAMSPLTALLQKFLPNGLEPVGYGENPWTPAQYAVNQMITTGTQWSAAAESAWLNFKG